MLFISTSDVGSWLGPEGSLDFQDSPPWTPNRLDAPSDFQVLLASFRRRKYM